MVSLQQITSAQTASPSWPSYLLPGGIVSVHFPSHRKIEKYSSLPNGYLFQPLAFEHLGSMNATTVTLIGNLGRKYNDERLFLVTIQSFNSGIVEGAFQLCR